MVNSDGSQVNLHEATTRDSLQWVVDNEAYLRGVVVSVCIKRRRVDLVDDIYSDVVIDRSARLLLAYDPNRGVSFSHYIRRSLLWEISKWFKRHNRFADRNQPIKPNDDKAISDDMIVEESDSVSRFIEFVRAEDTQDEHLETILKLRLADWTNAQIAFHLCRSEMQICRRVAKLQDLFNVWICRNSTAND